MRLPDHRAQALAAGATPKGPIEEGLVALLANQPAPPEVVYANEIYEDPYKSEVLEAFLLAGISPERTNTVLRVPQKVTEVYQYLFFDRAVFQDELDVESYAQSYPETTKEEKYGKELKVAAVLLGEDYLAFRFAHKEQEIDMAGALRSIITNAYMLTKATKLNPLDSNVAREARGWAGMAVKALEAYVRVKPATEVTDSEWNIALENIERTTNETMSGISRDEIAH